MIAFPCSQCRATLKVKAELAGKRIRCSRCQCVQEVPAAPAGAVTGSPCMLHDHPARGSAHEEATLPPAPRSASVAEADTLPRGNAAPLPGPTFTGAATDRDRDSARKTREVVKAGSSYDVGGEIARGGMGAIMRAVDQDIRREVAVKFLLNHADERQKTRFIEEAQITGQLEHPNIVPIHQLGVHDDGRCFFSMKMVKGRSLADILKEQADESGKSEFTLVRLLNIFSNICNALCYAHARAVIHRDLKPANIMVGDFGEVYVMDWGLAKVLGKASGVRGQESGIEKQTLSRPRSQDRTGQGAVVATARASDSNLTQDGAILGTPAYMPPEQATGEAGAVDQRSDIYSLGAILYEILTLSPPVGRGGDQLSVLLRVVEGAIKSPEKQAPERARQGLIPPELSAVALKALSKERADRYQTVEDLQRDIQLFLEGRSVSAKRDTAWELFKKLVKRNKGVSAATAAAVVVLAGVAGFFLKINYDARVLAENNYAAYLKEQEQRIQQGRDSIPSFLTAAKLLMEKRDFDAAAAQVRVALGFDPEHADVRFLNGQLRLVAQAFVLAQSELEFYARQRPDDPLARDLLEFLPRAKANDTNTAVLLAEICTRHQAHALADGALKSLADNAPAAREKLLTLYRQRLDHAWKGAGEKLHLDLGKGSFGLYLISLPAVTDLKPLQGMPLQLLNIERCPVRELDPLKGMPITHLVMPFTEVADLTPLRGMPLEYLDIRACVKLTSIEPLRGMPLTELNMPDCPNIDDIGPLRNMKLKSLAIWNDGRIKDLSPLRGQPLEVLFMSGLNGVEDFEPLRDLPLTTLHLPNTNIRDLEVLKGMRLKHLNLYDCRNVTKLAPLTGMPLSNLMLKGCRNVEDWTPLNGMPLISLNVDDTLVRDLTPLAKMKKLTTLSVMGCRHLEDLTPLAGLELRTIALTPSIIKKGMAILRDMKSLETVVVEGRGELRAAEFWKLFDKGEFKK